MPKIPTAKKGPGLKKGAAIKRGPSADQLASAPESLAMMDVIALAMCQDGAVTDEEFEPALEFAVSYISTPHSDDLTPRQVEQIREAARARMNAVIEKVEEDGFEDASTEIVGAARGSAPQGAFDAALSVFCQDESLDESEAAWLAWLAESLGLNMATVLSSTHGSGYSSGWSKGWDDGAAYVRENEK